LNLVDGPATLTYTSSNSNLFNINNSTGKTSVSKEYQTHKTQTVTVTVRATFSDSTYIEESKEITINPVSFDTMAHPISAYFAVSSTTNYMNNNTRYKSTGELFSDNTKQKLDIINYSFAIPQSDGTLTFNDTYIDQVKKLKNYGTRMILVIDGANSSPLKAMVQLCNNDSTRATFVNNIMNLVKTYNFDGVDIDWEFPGTSGLEGYTTEIDQINLNKLLRDLRNVMDTYQDPNGSPYLLTCAIPSSSWGSIRYKFTGNSTLGGINDYCDYVNMMSYDLNNESYTSHLSAAFSSTQSHDYKFSCNYGINKFTELGLDANKIILGSAAYGKAYVITESVSDTDTYLGLNKEAKLCQIKDLSGSYASGTIYYTAITSLMNSGNYTKYTEKNGDNIVGSYLLSNNTITVSTKTGNVTGRIFITYDSVESVQAKCALAKSNTGMGIMIWAYGEDATDTIVNTICNYNWD